MRRQAAYTRYTMLDATVTLRLPEELHHRLAAAAIATRRSLQEILLHALRIGGSDPLIVRVGRPMDLGLWPQPKERDGG